MGKEEVGTLIEHFAELPIEVTNKREFLILPNKEIITKIFTKKRLEILKVLKEQNPLSQTELAEILGRKRENVITDLKILEHFGLVSSEKEGQRVITRLNRDCIVIPLK